MPVPSHGTRPDDTAAASTVSPGRIDAALVRAGLARSRAHAARLVKDGIVLVDGRGVTRPSEQVAADAVIEVGHDADAPRFASRAGVKLDGALTALGDRGPGVVGVDCLDVGASTGGFTDVLLRRGARSVVALDVGHDQLRPEIREHPAVHVVEGFNVRDLTAGDLPTTPALVVADVSFISLTMVLPGIDRAVPGSADLLLMVKPQFEVGRERIGRTGVVRDDGLRAEAVGGVVTAAAGLGWGVRAIVPSPLPGPGGNREFFVWFTRAVPQLAPGDDTIGRAVAHPLDAGPTAYWPAPQTRTGGRS